MTESEDSRFRHEHPERPAVGSTLPPAPTIRRPVIVWLVPILTAISVLASIPALVLTYRHQASVRDDLERQLSDLQPDYSSGDVRVAVLSGLIVVIGLTIVFSLIELRASLKLMEKRRGARTLLLWMAVFHVPLIAMEPQLRDLDQYNHITTWIQGGALVLAVAVAYWFSVGRWLTAIERQGPIPLRPSAHR